MSRLSGGITAGRYRSMGVGPKENKNQNQSFPVQQFTSGIQEGPNTGYFTGGGTPSKGSTCDKFDLSTDTCTNVPNIFVITEGYPERHQQQHMVISFRWSCLVHQ